MNEYCLQQIKDAVQSYIKIFIDSISSVDDSVMMIKPCYNVSLKMIELLNLTVASPFNKSNITEDLIEKYRFDVLHLLLTQFRKINEVTAVWYIHSFLFLKLQLSNELMLTLQSLKQYSETLQLSFTIKRFDKVIYHYLICLDEKQETVDHQLIFKILLLCQQGLNKRIIPTIEVVEVIRKICLGKVRHLLPIQISNDYLLERKRVISDISHQIEKKLSCDNYRFFKRKFVSITSDNHEQLHEIYQEDNHDETCYIRICDVFVHYETIPTMNIKSFDFMIGEVNHMLLEINQDTSNAYSLSLFQNMLILFIQFVDSYVDGIVKDAKNVSTFVGVAYPKWIGSIDCICSYYDRNDEALDLGGEKFSHYICLLYCFSQGFQSRLNELVETLIENIALLVTNIETDNMKKLYRIHLYLEVVTSIISHSLHNIALVYARSLQLSQVLLESLALQCCDMTIRLLYASLSYILVHRHDVFTNQESDLHRHVLILFDEFQMKYFNYPHTFVMVILHTFALPMLQLVTCTSKALSWLIGLATDISNLPNLSNEDFTALDLNRMLSVNCTSLLGIGVVSQWVSSSRSIPNIHNMNIAGIKTLIRSLIKRYQSIVKCSNQDPIKVKTISILSFPVDIKRHVLSFLSHKRLCRIALTCRELYYLSNDQENIWKFLYNQKFYSKLLTCPSIKGNINWKMLFRDRLIATKKLNIRICKTKADMKICQHLGCHSIFLSKDEKV